MLEAFMKSLEHRSADTTTKGIRHFIKKYGKGVRRRKLKRAQRVALGRR